MFVVNRMSKEMRGKSCPSIKLVLSTPIGALTQFQLVSTSRRDKHLGCWFDVECAVNSSSIVVGPQMALYILNWTGTKLLVRLLVLEVWGGGGGIWVVV